MNKKESREFMMKVLFQMDAQKDFNVDQKDRFFGEENLGKHKDYCNNIFSLMCNKKDEIDAEISKFSQKWPISRMPKTDLAVLRLGAIEIMYLDTPDPVAINEAVEMAKIYGNDNSSRYINAILSNIAKDKEEK